jgi:hypothetical protein
MRGSVVACAGPASEQVGGQLAVQAFHLLKTYHRPDAQLVLTGPASPPGYGYLLRRFAVELGLPDVHFIASPTDADLAAVHQRADVWLAVRGSRADVSSKPLGVTLSVDATPSVIANAIDVLLSRRG